MTEKEAIRDFKKIEKLITKIEKGGYDIAVIECNYLTLTTTDLAKQRSCRVDNIDVESKEGGLNQHELLYTFQV